MRHGENALDVIGRVKHKIDEIRPGLPPGVDLEIAYDRTGLIHRSIGTLERALVEEAVVVALVIILFLLHVRSALLSAVYAEWPRGALVGAFAASAIAIVIGTTAYLRERPAARLLVWPSGKPQRG